MLPSPSKRHISDTGSGHSCKENGAHAQAQESLSPKIASALVSTLLPQSPALQAVSSIGAADPDTDMDAHLQYEHVAAVRGPTPEAWRVRQPVQDEPAPASRIAEPPKRVTAATAAGAFSSPVSTGAAPPAHATPVVIACDVSNPRRSARYERPRALHATPSRSPAQGTHARPTAPSEDPRGAVRSSQAEAAAPFPVAASPAAAPPVPGGERRQSFMPRDTPFEQRSQLRIGSPFHQIPTPASVTPAQHASPPAAAAAAVAESGGCAAPADDDWHQAQLQASIVPFSAPQYGVTCVQPAPTLAAHGQGSASSHSRWFERQRVASAATALVVALLYVCARCGHFMISKQHVCMLVWDCAGRCQCFDPSSK